METYEHTTFGQNLSIERRIIGLSREELAARMELSVETIADWEEDRSTPDLVNLKLLSRLLDVSIDDLLNDEPVKLPARKKNASIQNQNSSLPKEESDKSQTASREEIPEVIEVREPPSQRLLNVFVRKKHIEDAMLEPPKESSISRKEIHLASYPYKRSLLGRMSKTEAQKDAAVRECYPEAKIYMLAARQQSGPSEKAEKKSFYLVKIAENQLLVTVTPTYIESRKLSKNIDLMRFYTDQYEFTNVGLIPE